MKLKYEDVIKLAKYLEDKCRCSPIYIQPNHTGTVMVFNVTNTVGEKLTIELYDESYYQLPKVTKSEEL